MNCHDGKCANNLGGLKDGYCEPRIASGSPCPSGKDTDCIGNDGGLGALVGGGGCARPSWGSTEGDWTCVDRMFVCISSSPGGDSLRDYQYHSQPLGTSCGCHDNCASGRCARETWNGMPTGADALVCVAQTYVCHAWDYSFRTQPRDSSCRCYESCQGGFCRDTHLATKDGRCGKGLLGQSCHYNVSK